jgi:(1->4)-alpha-D-glucan 1-alpha-D-glucosylmutase
VPDIYQGNELWDFSLVDPDNRRPVNYVRRRQIFEGLRRWGNAPDRSSINCLIKAPEDGQIKSYLIWRTLCLRQQHADLFQKGEYLPLAVAGAKADHVIAFARRLGDAAVLVVVPRLISGLLDDTELPPVGPQIWEDTHVLPPLSGSGKQSQNVFTGEVADLGTRIDVSKILAEFPVALCLLG